jgi:hypothetical protein
MNDQYLDQDQYIDIQTFQIDSPIFTQTEIEYYAHFFEEATFDDKLNQIVNDCFTVAQISNEQYQRNDDYDDEAYSLLLPAIKRLLIHQLGLMKEVEVTLTIETPVTLH